MMGLKLERTEERLTRRTGLVLIDRFGKKIDLANKINREFGKPGSNRGMASSASFFMMPPALPVVLHISLHVLRASVIPPGIPSELLERRSDIAAAERHMAAAN